MRIIDMRPEVTPFDGADKRIRVHNWSYRDFTDGDNDIRLIHHYDTMMGQYVRESAEVVVDGGNWRFIPVSIGHGTASDQGGMNQLMSVVAKWQRGGTVLFKDYGYHYSRDRGNPRIERTEGQFKGTVVA